jgi:hypothetical protein
MANRRMPSLVQASQFDPTQGPATYYDPSQRMATLHDQFAANPGSAPGGSGTTGLMSGDARGYSRMLEQQQEYLRLKGLLKGTGDPEIEVGGVSSTRTLGDANGRPVLTPGYGNPQSAVGNESMIGLNRVARPKRGY